MKKLFTVLLLLLIFNSKVYSQCEFAKYSDAPHAGASVRSFHLLKVKNNNE